MQTRMNACSMVRSKYRENLGPAKTRRILFGYAHLILNVSCCTPGSHLVCTVRSLLGVSREILSGKNGLYSLGGCQVLHSVQFVQYNYEGLVVVQLLYSSMYWKLKHEILDSIPWVIMPKLLHPLFAQ